MKWNNIILIFILLPSCVLDHVSNTFIENKSSDQISVTIFYNRQALDSIYKFDTISYNAFLRQKTNYAHLPLHLFDSINLTSKYILPPRSNLIIDERMNEKSDYTTIKKIEIVVNHRILVYINESFDTAFRKTESGLWGIEIR